MHRQVRLATSGGGFLDSKTLLDTCRHPPAAGDQVEHSEKRRRRLVEAPNHLGCSQGCQAGDAYCRQRAGLRSSLMRLQ